MRRSVKRARDWMPVASAVLIAVAAMAAGATGCGSGEDGTSATSGSPAGSGRQSARANEASSAPSGTRRPSSGHVKAGESSARHADGAAGVRSATGRRARTHVAAGRLRSLGRKAAKSCPSGVGAVQCGVLVEAFANRSQAQPQEVNTAGDCVKAMSRANCEALLGAQSAAAEESGSPVDVEACMRNPTPRCEEVLGRMLEEQRAAE